jgi:hypothetical protein
VAVGRIRLCRRATGAPRSSVVEDSTGLVGFPGEVFFLLREFLINHRSYAKNAFFFLICALKSSRSFID